MNTRFRVDLLHPGEDLRQGGLVGKGWEDWFVGAGAARRLGLFALVSFFVLAVILVTAILLPSWHLSADVSSVPELRKDLAVRQADLDLLRSTFAALNEEARQQVRWAELLGVLSREMPPSLKLQAVEATRGPVSGAPGQRPEAAAGSPSVIRVDAVTPVRPGGPPLLEVAQFMAGLMRDPTVGKRYLLRSWEIKPGATESLLNISIVLGERAQ